MDAQAVPREDPPHLRLSRLRRSQPPLIPEMRQGDALGARLSDAAGGEWAHQGLQAVTRRDAQRDSGSPGYFDLHSERREVSYRVHLALAAFFAIADRFFPLSFFARALPPANPPFRLAAVAALSAPWASRSAAPPSSCPGSAGELVHVARALRVLSYGGPSGLSARQWSAVTVRAGA